jgi:hypothetical protein
MNIRSAAAPLLLACVIAAPGAALAASKGKVAAPASKGAAASQANWSEESRVKRGYEIAPVPLNLAGRNRALVGLGSYIVNAQAGCNDCHTWPNFAPNGNPYLGQPKMVNAENYLAGGRPFGPFRSRNITPDPASTMTEEERYQEFVSLIRTGLDPDYAHPNFGPLLQVMPWSVYQDMTDHDLRAIFEYLQAIPHAEPYCEGAHLSEAICQP